MTTMCQYPSLSLIVLISSGILNYRDFISLYNVWEFHPLTGKVHKNIFLSLPFLHQIKNSI